MRQRFRYPYPYRHLVLTKWMAISPPRSPGLASRASRPGLDVVDLPAQRVDAAPGDALDHHLVRHLTETPSKAQRERSGEVPLTCRPSSKMGPFSSWWPFTKATKNKKCQLKNKTLHPSQESVSDTKAQGFRLGLSQAPLHRTATGLMALGLWGPQVTLPHPR